MKRRFCITQSNLQKAGASLGLAKGKKVVDNFFERKCRERSKHSTEVLITKLKKAGGCLLLVHISQYQFLF